jgi:Tetracyclin repressor-like, C-terminal domain
MAHPDHFRLMFLRPVKDGGPALQETARASFAVLEEAIADAHARRLLRPGMRPREVVSSAWALVHGVASLVVGGQLSASARALKPHIATATAIFLDGAYAAKGDRHP